MSQRRVHFPRTTAGQRKLLFETWEATQDVEAACQKAHVCAGTFYRWKPRYERGGQAALEHFASHAPKHPHRTPSAVEAQVLDLQRAHPAWGKQRLSSEVAKANGWVPMVSPNTVKRILKDAGLWSTIESTVKKGGLNP